MTTMNRTFASKFIKQGVVFELILLTIMIVVAYANTSFAIYELWTTSETYSHGILIIPMSIYLIWQRCKYLQLPATKPNLIGLVAILFFGFMWLCGNLVKINLISHFSIVALVPSYVLFRFGFTILNQFKGPLLFLFFAVPFGDFLIPHLQQITAVISVWLVNLIGIPVYNDGLYISIPNANFLVAEACSGIRFLISSFTLGIFFALLAITDVKKRWFFILLSFIFPILANGMRVFIIVVIGYYVSVEAATGFDHLVYGWIFFSFVLLSLFYIGSRLQDKSSEQPSEKEDALNYVPPTPLLATAIALSLLVFPVMLHVIEPDQQESVTVNNKTDSQQLDIAKVQKSIPWAPVFDSPDLYDYKPVQVGVNPAHYFVISYFDELGEKELITFNNRIFSDEIFSQKYVKTAEIEVNNSTLQVKHIHIVSLSGLKINILVTYQVGENFETNVGKVKLLQLIAKIKNTDHGGTAHIISAEESIVSVEQLKTLFSVQLNQLNRS
ncbi:exosortase [Psychrosphaera sp. B3R10]|uniref:exosortase A n=1 Tax=unclassified Psychrosphaera TaxID=2641570 RepID=UPI001C09ADB3|nr:MULTISPECIES: exosortase A [unclassified Psychrosphaera]MBU2883713.1 exosortase [Psychrosphaera sp. I2R16]MBU2987985.1 exosortase [Psychrosphaera sp. B3R10]